MDILFISIGAKTSAMRNFGRDKYLYTYPVELLCKCQIETILLSVCYKQISGTISLIFIKFPSTFNALKQD